MSSTKRTLEPEHWTNAIGPLTPPQQAAAERSYAAWQRVGGQHPFQQYVSYVQDRRRARPDEGSLSVAMADDGPEVVGPGGERGWTRRKRHLANTLAGTYDDSNLSAQTRRNINRVEISQKHGIATMYLRDGSHLRDHGDRLTLHNAQDYAVGAAEMAASAARKGWSAVQLTGPQAFLDEAAFAHGMLEPPIPTDPPASEAVQARIAAAIAMRVSASAAQDIAADVVAEVTQTVAPGVLTAADIIRAAIAESNQRTAKILAQRPGDFDAKARSRELSSYERAARGDVLGKAVAAERHAVAARAAASLFNRQSRRDASDAERAAVQARDAVERYDRKNHRADSDVEERVRAEASARQKTQQSFDRRADVQAALDEQATNRLVLTALDDGDPEIAHAVEHGGLAAAQRIALSRTTQVEIERRLADEAAWAREQEHERAMPG